MKTPKIKILHRPGKNPFLFYNLQNINYLKDDLLLSSFFRIRVIKLKGEKIVIGSRYFFVVTSVLLAPSILYKDRSLDEHLFLFSHNTFMLF